jgi:hypothetical protein
MKIRTAFLTGCVVAVTGSAAVVGVSVANPPPNVPLPEREVTTVASVPAPPRWAEDSLPPELYLWLGGPDNGGNLVRPRRADRWANAYYPNDRHHRGCWAAVSLPRHPGNGTTLIMCPDGLVAYS